MARRSNWSVSRLDVSERRQGQKGVPRRLTEILLKFVAPAALGVLSCVAANAATECFLYDELGRLKTAVHTDGKLVAYDLDAAGNRENLNTTTPADSTAPSNPSGLTASAVSSSQIQLSWSGSTDNICVAAWQVERCTGAGCGSFTLLATALSPRHTDTGLTGSTSYSYRVRAQDHAGNFSGYSNTATAVTPSGIPSAPTVSANFTIVIEGGSYTVFWTAMSGATEYKLFRSVNGSAFTLNYQGTALSKIFTNATPADYTYRAQACNANGCSANSNEVTVSVCPVAGCE